MTDHHSIPGQSGLRHAPSRLPPDWLLAPYLRPSRRDKAAAPSAAVANGVTRSRPQKARRNRTIPFPAWRDEKGAPLATLLGPPNWR